MHTCPYAARENIGAVIHTHSTHATAFAVAHEPLPCAYEPLLRYGAKVIPVAEWAPRGSRQAVNGILAAISEHPHAVLLANHGLLAFAHDPLNAARLVRAIEEAAEVTLGAGDSAPSDTPLIRHATPSASSQ
ncbi:MAG: class II aldolase/adducin family protein [Actinomycetota bacterium]|nr:class II aldolase/adducin family protein [Actinomycetota bacterium]